MENLSHLFGKILHIDESLEHHDTAPILSQHNIKGIVEYIKEGKCSNVIVLTGAGISTAAGIPDFRSPSSGLYHNLKEYNLPYPEAIFDISYFKKNPEPFFKLSRFLWPEKLKPTVAHYFIRLLFEKKLLLRNYTQNIDTLELLAGIPDQKTIEAHGSFRTGKCTKCGHVYDYAWLKNSIFKDPSIKDNTWTVCDDQIQNISSKSSTVQSQSNQSILEDTATIDPKIQLSQQCSDKEICAEDYDRQNFASTSENAAPSDIGKKESSCRSSRLQPKLSKEDKAQHVDNKANKSFGIPLCTVCGSVVKPDIVFFGEPLPARFFTSIRNDFPLCDLLIIMGTSLVVQPFASLVDYVKPKVPRLLINKEKTSAHNSIFRFLGISKGMDFESNSKNARDVFWKGTCDDGCRELIKLLGWEDDLKRVMNDDLSPIKNDVSNV